MIRKILERVFIGRIEIIDDCDPHHHRHPHHAVLVFTFPGATVRGHDMTISLSTTAPVGVTFTYVDASGNPIPAPAGSPAVSWTAPDPTLATIDRTTGVAVNLAALANVTGSTAISATDGTFTASEVVAVATASGTGAPAGAILVVGPPVA